MKSIKALNAENLPTAVELLSGFDAEYHAQFLPPSETCPRCGSEYHITWGLAHGEAHCTTRKCGYPSRVYHFRKDADGKEFREVRNLQYHPSMLKEAEAARE